MMFQADDNPLFSPVINLCFRDARHNLAPAAISRAAVDDGRLSSEYRKKDGLR